MATEICGSKTLSSRLPSNLDMDMDMDTQNNAIPTNKIHRYLEQRQNNTIDQ